MSTNDRDMQPPDRDHPSDLLPDFLRGGLNPDQEREVSVHVEDCSACAEELDVLSLLAEQPVPAMTAEERDRMYERIDLGGIASTGSPGRSDWRSAVWKIAAAIALLATGVGVWQVYLAGSSEAGWSATAALEAWDEDIREIDPSSEDAQALLAFFETSGPQLGGGLGTDPALDRVVDDVLDGIAVPWEEEQ